MRQLNPDAHSELFPSFQARGKGALPIVHSGVIATINRSIVRARFADTAVIQFFRSVVLIRIKLFVDSYWTWSPTLIPLCSCSFRPASTGFQFTGLSKGRS